MATMAESRLDVFVVAVALLTSCFAQKQGRFYLLNKKIGNVETALKDEISVLVSEMTNLYAELESVQGQLKANNDSTDERNGDTSDMKKQLEDLASETQQLKASLQMETEHRTSLVHQLTTNQQEFSRALVRLGQAFGAEKFARRQLQSEVKELTARVEVNKGHLVSMATELSDLKSSVAELQSEVRGNCSMAVGQLNELTTAMNDRTVRLFKLENDTQELFKLAQKAGDSVSTLSEHFNATLTAVVAGNVQGSSNTTQVVAPTAFLGPAKLTVPMGTTGTLRCVVTGVPEPTVTWLKSRGELASNHVVNGSVLRITNAVMEDRGIYVCRAENAAGVDQDWAVVEVELRKPLKIEVYPNTTKWIAVGGRALFQCRVMHGDPQPTYSWTRAGGVPLTTRTTTMDNGVIMFKQASKEEQGAYICTATTDMGTGNATATLIVGDMVPYFTQNPASYISYPVLTKSKVRIRFTILLILKPESTEGLILYNSDARGIDFVCFGLRMGYPEFRFDLGTGPAIIRGNETLALNKWHTVKLSRNQLSGVMEIGERPAYTGRSAGRARSLRLTGNMYLGGVPDYNAISGSAGFSEGFVGAIGEVQINGISMNLGAEALRNVGVVPYIECNSNPCQNGGTCVPTHTQYGYKCLCPPGYSGGQCESVGERCYPGACGEQGHCRNLEGQIGFRCVCPPGQTGSRCQIGTMDQRTQPRCERGSCYPATGNLLIGREAGLTANSTCGLYIPERYCVVKLLDENECSVCDSRRDWSPVSRESHRIENIVSSSFREQKYRWWQAENGVSSVYIQLDLEAEFHVTHLVITFKTFRPKAMYIERSIDNGRTWKPYRYFAYDCAKSFPGIATGPVRGLTDVICTSRYSDVAPSTDGEVIFRTLPPFIQITDYSKEVQDLLRLTNLRVVLTELHTLGDIQMESRKGIREKYYYAIYDMTVRGSCLCHGHASRWIPVSDYTTNPDMVNGQCDCTHNTRGINCEMCKELYNDLPWTPAQPSDPRACKKCECNNHTETCHFDPAVYEFTRKQSGGVCDDCQHNTMGRNCQECRPFFFSDPSRDIRDPQICQPCDCDPAGSQFEGECERWDDADLGLVAGQCICKTHVTGRRCDRCYEGYWNLDRNNMDGCEPL